MFGWKKAAKDWEAAATLWQATAEGYRALFEDALRELRLREQYPEGRVTGEAIEL